MSNVKQGQKRRKPIFSTPVYGLQIFDSLCYNLTGTITRDRSRWDKSDEQEKAATLCLGVAGTTRHAWVYYCSTPGSGLLPGNVPGWCDPSQITIFIGRAAAGPDCRNIWRLPFI